MLIEVASDEQLIALLSTTGFLVNVDYPTKKVKLHKINCRYCDPQNPFGVKPSNKRLKETGEFWFSDNRNETHSKAEEIASKRGYTYSFCPICKP